jgi:predicted Rossmann fold flavoprotein
MRTAENRGVQFLLDTHISEVMYNTSFRLKCNTQTIEANRLLVATGGLARPQIGASPLGYSIAEQFGHTVIPLKPALAGFILPQTSPLRHLQGISLDVQLQIQGKNNVVTEPLLFTHQGISGPAALQVSCFWEKGDTILVNFLPSEDLIQHMHKPENGRLQVKTLIAQFLPERLTKTLLPEPFPGRKVAELSKLDRKMIAGCIHRFPVLPDAVEGFSKAEVTLGGVATHELNPKSMESLLQAGLFFSGEVIDITGKLGGYNLHWAFASGRLAGQNI